MDSFFRKLLLISSGVAFAPTSLNPKVISIFPSFGYGNTALAKSLTGGILSCTPLPSRSVFNAGGIISITSIFLGFNICLSERVKEWKKDFVAQ